MQMYKYVTSEGYSGIICDEGRRQIAAALGCGPMPFNTEFYYSYGLLKAARDLGLPVDKIPLVEMEDSLWIKLQKY